MKKLFITAMLLASMAPQSQATSGNRMLLDEDWLFHYSATPLPACPDSSDSGWQRLSLPHDWSVAHDFNRDEPSGNDGGYLPTGCGWYRKIINIPEESAGKPCHLYLEGIYMDSDVLCNGQSVGGHPYGYTSFRCDLTPHLKAGENEIIVKVDNSKQKNCRWYTGSGIYRHVWLEPHGDIFVEPWSMHVTTPVVSKDKSVARIDFTLASAASGDISLPVKIAVESPDGRIFSSTDTVRIYTSEKLKYCSYEIPVSNTKLWSCSNPAIYKASVALHLPDGTTETESEKFGFRTIAYSADSGFLLNGEPIVISGACLHHDNGILGAASYDDAETRKAQLIKDAGFNAVRTSHNPPAPAFLDACDSLGLLVIDEAFDGWRSPKNAHDYAVLFDDWWERDLSAMVMRDRNHPGIICWSIGNEIIERKSPEAVATARMLASKCRELDPSRPVTSALAAWDPDWDIYDPLAAQHDIVGYNYMLHMAESDHARVPSRVMWQTESYPRDAFKNWKLVSKHPYIIGDFVWTGIDYIGESGIGRYYYEGDPAGEHFERPLWPWHNSYCGDIDITGQRKPISHYREILYSSAPKMYMSVSEPDGYRGKIRETMWGTAPARESWNWPGHEGKPIDVTVASNYPEVELFQDGHSLDRKPTGETNEFKAVFTTSYRPGKLTAVAYDKTGVAADSMSIATAGKPYAIRLRADKNTLTLGRQSLAYISAEVVDRNGQIVPDAEINVNFSVAGDAEIIATGSGNPKDSMGYRRHNRTTDAGRALGIVKLSPSAAQGIGKIKVTAKAKGLRPGAVVLDVR